MGIMKLYISQVDAEELSGYEKSTIIENLPIVYKVLTSYRDPMSMGIIYVIESPEITEDIDCYLVLYKKIVGFALEGRMAYKTEITHGRIFPEKEQKTKTKRDSRFALDEKLFFIE